MNKPLLSICIPTYNRAGYIEKSLESLIAQNRFSEIEIVISDNCSTDATEEICKKFSNRYSNIVYFRNSRNIYDMNFPTVLMKATGIYRKLSNDYLVYENGSIATILSCIEKYREDRPFLFFLNGQKLPEKIESITECCDFEKFCILTGHRLTWIASFGLWDEQCIFLEEETRYCEMRLWQTFKALQIVSEYERAVLISERIASVQKVRNKDYSYGLYTVFYKNFPALLMPYIANKKLSDTAFRKIRKDMLYTQAAPLIFQMPKDCNLGNEKNCKKLILNEYSKEPYYIGFIVWYLFNYKIKYRVRIFFERVKKTTLGKKLLPLKRKLKLKLY